MRTLRILLLALAVSSPAARELRAAPPHEAGAAASDEAEQAARAHYARGEAAFKAERFQEALTEFEAGYAAVQRPGFLLNIAHAARRLGDLQKARANYKKFLLIEPTSKFRDDTIAIVAEIDSALADEDRARPHPAATPAPPPLLTAPAPPVRGGGPALLSAMPASDAAASESEARGPIYRRTWVWVAAGVLLATGAGVGFYYWQRPASDPYQVAGTLGSLGR